MDTTASRERGYHDRPELTVDGLVDLDDGLERAAIAMHRMTFAVPEEVAGMFGSRAAELVFTWTRLEPAQRHLWRRRAVAVLEAADYTAPAELEPIGDFDVAELEDLNAGVVVQPA